MVSLPAALSIFLTVPSASGASAAAGALAALRIVLSRDGSGVLDLVEGDVYHWGALMAGALFGSLPVAILYSFFVEHYVSGMTGSVKE